MVLLRAAIVKGVVDFRPGFLNNSLTTKEDIINTVLLAIGMRICGKVAAMNLLVHRWDPHAPFCQEGGEVPTSFIRVPKLKVATDTRETDGHSPIEVEPSYHQVSMLNSLKEGPNRLKECIAFFSTVGMRAMPTENTDSHLTNRDKQGYQSWVLM